MRVVIVSHMLSGTANTVGKCKLFLIGVSHLPDQLSRGNIGIAGVLVPGSLERFGGWGGCGGRCRVIGLTLALIVLVCELARHLQPECSLLQFRLPFSCGVFRAWQEITAKCFDRESPFSP